MVKYNCVTRSSYFYVVDGVEEYKWRKWSRIRKVKHRNKKAVNKEIKYEIK